MTGVPAPVFVHGPAKATPEEHTLLTSREESLSSRSSIFRRNGFFEEEGSERTILQPRQTIKNGLCIEPRAQWCSVRVVSQKVLLSDFLLSDVFILRGDKVVQIEEERSCRFRRFGSPSTVGTCGALYLSVFPDVSP